MRISVREHDPGYRNEATTGKYEAYLDGERVDMCITADEEKGYIEKYKLDEDGNHMFGFDKDDIRYLETEELHGNVEIKEKDV